MSFIPAIPGANRAGSPAKAVLPLVASAASGNTGSGASTDWVAGGVDKTVKGGSGVDFPPSGDEFDCEVCR